jgi:histone deacetylase 1/2
LINHFSLSLKLQALKDLLEPYVSSFSVSNSQCNNVESNVTSTSTISVKDFPSLYKMWHNRLGHPHHEAHKNVMKLCNQQLPNKNAFDFCSACCLGKVHRLPSLPSSASYQKPFELVFCDLWGRAPVESSCGYSYFLTCVDAYTRFTWIFPLKLKSHTLLTFQNFKNMVELQYNLPIKFVQTDGGGEFRPFTQYLTPLGIIHRLTCPHTHHQNRSVERKHRHIVETGLTLLAQANMPLKFWDHAFLTTTYLINRLPSSTLENKSPYFLLNSQIPDYKFLKNFGCVCFPFLRPYSEHKMNFHSKECIFLGYSTSHKDYKCLDSTGRIFLSKDVLFNEARYLTTVWQVYQSVVE